MNKRASNHRHTFCPSILLKMSFMERKPSFFKFQKNTLPPFFILYFSKLKKFLTFFAKILANKKEKIFSGNYFISYTFQTNFATFTDFEKKSDFSGKTQFSYVFEKSLLFQSHSSENLMNVLKTLIFKNAESCAG